MTYLLDTPVFLRHLMAPEKLSAGARRILGADDSDCRLSIASGWEIAIKHSLGRLTTPLPPVDFVESRRGLMGARLLPIDYAAKSCTSPPMTSCLSSPS